MRIGTSTPSAYAVGNSPVSRIYQGTTLVYEAGGEDVTAPTFTATIENDNPDVLNFAFIEDVLFPNLTGLSLDGDFSDITLSNLAGSGTSWTADLSRPALSGETGNVVASGSTIEDLNENALADGSTAVTNEVIVVEYHHYAEFTTTSNINLGYASDIDIKRGAGLGGSKAFTISCWIDVANFSSPVRRPLSISNPTDKSIFTIGVFGNGNPFAIFTSANNAFGGRVANSVSIENQGRLNHLVVTCDGMEDIGTADESIKIYLNGVRVDNGDNNGGGVVAEIPESFTGDWMIGVNYGGGGTQYLADAELSNLAIWVGQSASLAQVEELYDDDNRFKDNRTTSLGNPQRYIRFDSVIEDLMGNDITIGGSVINLIPEDELI